jgi:uncharacterized alpha-E superfamily protein
VTDHVLERAKAYAALVGAVVTVLLGQVPASSQYHAVLVTVGAVATAVATYKIPNKPRGK